MSTFSRPFIALAMMMGLLVGQIAPAYASQDSNNDNDDDRDSVAASVVLARAKTRAERILLRTERHVEVKAKVEAKVKAQTGAVIEARASYGKLVSGLRLELNTFSAWLKVQLRNAGSGIAALSLEARAQLYSNILAKIHSALLALRTDISATISAAVGAGSSASSSLSSSSSSSTSSLFIVRNPRRAEGVSEALLCL